MWQNSDFKIVEISISENRALWQNVQILCYASRTIDLKNNTNQKSSHVHLALWQKQLKSLNILFYQSKLSKT